MADPTTALLVISAVAEGGKLLSQQSEAESKTQALELQQKEMTIQNQQKTLSNFDITKKLLDRQMAQASVSGLDFSSPSFNAIRRDTLNTSAKEFKNLELEGTLGEANTDIEKKNVKNTLYAQMFGDTADTGFSFAKYREAAPNTGK